MREVDREHPRMLQELVDPCSGRERGWMLSVSCRQSAGARAVFRRTVGLEKKTFGAEGTATHC